MTEIDAIKFATQRTTNFRNPKMMLVFTPRGIDDQSKIKEWFKKPETIKQIRGQVAKG